jgi:hypothetical protein
MRQMEKLDAAYRSIRLGDHGVGWGSPFSMASWVVSRNSQGRQRQLLTVDFRRHGTPPVNSSYELSVASAIWWDSLYAVPPPGEFVEKGL